MTGSIAPNRPGHHGTVVARTVGTVAISCNARPPSHWSLTIIEIEPIPDDSVGKYRAEGVEWAI